MYMKIIIYKLYMPKLATHSMHFPVLSVSNGFKFAQLKAFSKRVMRGPF